ncbi:MAG: glycoside hydrolase family 5 protein [Bryobacteraceae bacterium]|nr:glycoside hydrolase family 5 protein [Bryobacteraceae bacterium]MDW8377019.1 cellulase family glycosylhydrolase [Bryobacterales bacterium]
MSSLAFNYPGNSAPVLNPVAKLSAHLPPLCVQGNHLCAGQQPVLLRGVNRSGLEYAEPGEVGFLASAGLTEHEMETICRHWGASIVRLPLNQDWALQGRGAFSDEDYLSAVDQVIAWAASFGAYTLLDLQWLSKEQEFGKLADGSPNRIAPLPDENSPRFWRKLALRYRDEPGVLFDLYNEPHDCSREDWRQWAKLLLHTIREVHPQALCFVSGVDWGYDLRGVFLDEPNVVYSTHVYPDKVLPWSRAFGCFASEAPLFAGEWGGTSEHVEWGRRLAAFFRQLRMGWTAWSWSDYPYLMRHGQPTEFGALVQQELRRTAT